MLPGVALLGAGWGAYASIPVRWHQIHYLDWLGVTFESIRCMRQQLLLALRNLVGMQFELIAQLCRRLVLRQSCQRHLRSACWRTRAPSAAC